jgi:23S rRNA pseudouridine2457 synthase
VADIWIQLVLTEGKNRQVRRMTAAIGHPTLRLIRVAIGRFWLGELESGHWRELSPVERELILKR